MFARLKDLRDKLASIPAFACDAETRRELVAAIDELDDAMVMEVRAMQYVRDTPASAVHEELLTLFAGTATTEQEIVQ